MVQVILVVMFLFDTAAFVLCGAFTRGALVDFVVCDHGGSVVWDRRDRSGAHPGRE
jgi:hypothetical protein